jgi:endonuclease III
VSDKSQRFTDLLAKIPELPTALPSPEGRTLLEVGFLCVLARRLSDGAAEKTLAALAGAFPDWNELRVSQVQEFQHLVQTKSPELAAQVARDAREYLQEVFQKVHGFNLDGLKGDMAEASRFATNLGFIGASVGHYLLHLACPTELPVSPSIVRTLDRLGLSKRTTSLKKAQASLEGSLPAALWRDFAVRVGYVVERWCDARKPTCWQCPLVLGCPFGKRVEREWKQSQRRLELQRIRDEERTRKEAEKERRRAAAEEKRRVLAKAKESARRAREAERARARQAAAKLAAAKAARRRPVEARTRKKSAPTKRVNKTAVRARRGTKGR